MSGREEATTCFSQSQTRLSFHFCWKMFSVWLLFAFTPLAVHSKSIRWTFQLEEANYISVDTSIGTPPQATSLLIATREKIPDLWVGVPDADGTFNPNISNTATSSAE
ncbi:hypothetical protein M3Y99_01314400 [Aphelenchoides fujianensis]|nr:hypothetical protein M3Y99_01314400 [Aphelenchoides fujianensis]